MNAESGSDISLQYLKRWVINLKWFTYKVKAEDELISSGGFELVWVISELYRCRVRVHPYLQRVLSSVLGSLVLGWHILSVRLAQHQKSLVRLDETGGSGSSFMVNSHGHCTKTRRKQNEQWKHLQLQTERRHWIIFQNWSMTILKKIPNIAIFTEHVQYNPKKSFPQTF